MFCPARAKPRITAVLRELIDWIYEWADLFIAIFVEPKAMMTWSVRVRIRFRLTPSSGASKVNCNVSRRDFGVEGKYPNVGRALFFWNELYTTAQLQLHLLLLLLLLLHTFRLADGWPCELDFLGTSCDRISKWMNRVGSGWLMNQWTEPGWLPIFGQSNGYDVFFLISWWNRSRTLYE